MSSAIYHINITYFNNIYLLYINYRLIYKYLTFIAYTPYS